MSTCISQFMPRRNLVHRTARVVALALAVAMPPAVSAATKTLTASGNWVGGAWTNGVPEVGDDAVIAAGVSGTANGVVTAWQGSLTLAAGSKLNVLGNPSDFIALAGATTIHLNNGAKIFDNFKTRTLPSNIVVHGGGGFETNSTAGYNQGRTLTGVISGDGGFRLRGQNQMGYFFNVPNSFTGGLVLDSSDRYGVQFNAPGAAGAGNVTVLPASSGRSAVIRLGADGVFAPTATLTLNGAGWNHSTGGFGPFADIFNGSATRIDMQRFNATVHQLIIDGVALPAGSYTAASNPWIKGTGTLTVHPITSNNPLVNVSGAGGNVGLSWNNLTPITGTAVWVDVWFGTDPAALTQVAAAQLNLTSFTVNAPNLGTYFVRIDSYLNGDPNGTPVTGTLSSFMFAAPSELRAESWFCLPPAPSVLNLQKHGIAKRAPDTVSPASAASISNLPIASGTRLRGTVTPSVAGIYTFYIAGGDNVALWLSTDSSRFNKQLIARHYGTTGPDEWDKYLSQQAAPVELAVGTCYYIEAQVMNASEVGHLAIAWSGPNMAGPQPIPPGNVGPLVADPADLDDDNLPDAWEHTHGLDPNCALGADGEYGDVDNDGISNFNEFQLAADPAVKDALGNGLTRERWYGVHGETIDDLTSNRARFLLEPNERLHVPNIDEAPDGEALGTRYRGFLTAPVTGAYFFWIAGDDQAELWLAAGTVKDPATGTSLTNRYGKQLIANDRDELAASSSTDQRDFDAYASQRSRAVTLTAGQSYYVEVLHQQAEGEAHVAVAWQIPGHSRTIIPPDAFTSDLPEDDDLDDDNLPAAWESTPAAGGKPAYALNPADNGFTDPADGQYGDPDADGLTNLAEYQLGTHPRLADTDGDGLADQAERDLYHTDPLVSNRIDFGPATLLPPQQYSATTLRWTSDPAGTLTAIDRRDEISYTFTIAADPAATTALQPGILEVNLSAAAAGVPRTTENLPLVFTIDGHRFAATTLTSLNGAPATATVLTPWLTAGPHTLTILHDNYRAEVALRIHGLSLRNLGGEDLNSNGCPDWLDQRLAADNRLTRIPTTSLTSPVCIEGLTSYLSGLTLTAGGTAVPVSESIDATFYANIPLDETGAATTLTSTFQAAALTENHVITWAAADLSVLDTIDLRQGDSLRLDATNPPGPVTSSHFGTYSVALDGTILPTATGGSNHHPGQPFKVTFNTPGTHPLAVTYHGNKPPRTVTVRVHAADFGPALSARAFYARDWAPPAVGPDAIVVPDSRLAWLETSAAGAPARSFRVNSTAAGARRVLARLPEGLTGAPGAILACGTVNTFYLAYLDETSDIAVIFTYPDGTKLMRGSIVAVGLPPDIAIRLNTYYQGTVFLDGSNQLWLTAADFDRNGIADLYFEWAGQGDPYVCTYVDLFTTTPPPAP